MIATFSLSPADSSPVRANCGEPKGSRFLTRQRLLEILRYDPDTGHFTWLPRPLERFAVGHRQEAAHAIFHKRYSGRIAGRINDRGYVCINIGGSPFQAHRLAWLYQTGSWPEDQIDHANGDPADNRWSNLRQATPSQNTANCGIRSDNSTGVKGVSFDRRTRRPWIARIKVHGRDLYLGSYTSLDEAREVYRAAALFHFGEFARVA